MSLLVLFLVYLHEAWPVMSVKHKYVSDNADAYSTGQQENVPLPAAELLLSYTKVVKIAAVSDAFSQLKICQNAFAFWAPLQILVGKFTHASGRLGRKTPLLDGIGISISNVFGNSSLGASTCCPGGTHY